MSNPDVKAMEKILAKMNNAVENADQVKSDRAAGKTVVNEKNQEMYDILSKLHNVTQKATTQFLTENPKEAAVSAKKENRIQMGNYVIEMERKELSPKIFKTYYNILEDGEIVNTLALFESAMAILKEATHNNYSNTNKIIELDAKYDSHLIEAAQQKYRAKTDKESIKKNIYTAKQGQAISKMKQIKQEIKSLI